jgi:hypothetical protein
MFEHFWDLDRLVEDGAPRRNRYHGYHLLSRIVEKKRVIRVYVTSMGCHPMGLTMFRMLCKCINK